MNIIEVQNLTIKLNLASEEITSFKEYLIKIIKKQITFQEFYALKDISFCITKGDSLGIIGANGAGKSTLLKTLAGIYQPYEGFVRVDGMVAPLIELGAGFDGQLTARENIYLNGALFGYNRNFMQKKIEEIIGFAELGDFIDVPIRNYSSGMVARLGFSIATMVKPDILICDEILSVGDIKFQKKCEKRMDELKKSGCTLLFVSHSIDQVRKICNHTIYLENGMLKAYGKTEDICNSYIKDQTS